MWAAIPECPRAPRSGPWAQAREACKDLHRPECTTEQHVLAASPRRAGLGGAAGRAESMTLWQPGQTEGEATLTLLEAAGHGRIPRAGYKAALQRERPRLRRPLKWFRPAEQLYPAVFSAHRAVPKCATTDTEPVAFMNRGLQAASACLRFCLTFGLSGARPVGREMERRNRKSI